MRCLDVFFFFYTLDKSSNRSPRNLNFSKTSTSSEIPFISLYFMERYFIHEVIKQIIIFIDQLTDFLLRKKDRYPHSVKSHLNVHSKALKTRESNESNFSSKNLVYQTTKRSCQ